MRFSELKDLKLAKALPAGTLSKAFSWLLTNYVNPENCFLGLEQDFTTLKLKYKIIMGKFKKAWLWKASENWKR